MSRGSMMRSDLKFQPRFNEELKAKLIERNKKHQIDNEMRKKEFEEKRKEFDETRKVKVDKIRKHNEENNIKRVQKNNETVSKFRVVDSARNVRNVNRAKTVIGLNRSNGEVSSIIMELERAGVIKDQDNVSFNFNNNELIVNGAKQSSQLHEQLKQKYLRKAGDFINYSKNGNTTSTTISRE
jgi:hypothetical protein